MNPRFSLTVLVLITAALAAAAQTPAAPAKGLAAIDAILQKSVRQGDVPGVVAIVAGKDRILYQGAAGMMNAAGRKAMRPDAIFRIASMTKPVTAVAIMMLQEQGKLSVEDPASKFLPALKDREVLATLDEKTGAFTARKANQEILIRHLLSNTSGFGYTFSSPALKAMATKAQKAPEDLPILHEPGAQWTYGMSAKLLGQIVEKVSGLPLDRFFETRIFKPLALTDTFYLVPDAKRSRVATVNRRDKGRLVEASNPARIGSRSMGDGGLHATAADYARFLQMFLNDGQARGAALLHKDSIDAMTRNQIGDIFVETQQSTDFAASLPFPFGAGRDKFGFALQIASNSDEPFLRSAGSYSWAGSYNTHFWVDPARQVAVVVMMQVTPFYDARCMKLIADIEEAVGRALPR